MITFRKFAEAVAVTALLASPALAHHSGAMFDKSKLLTFKGVVQSFEWTNPHIRIMVVGDPTNAGATKTWMIESTSPGRLSRDGWTRTSLKPGDNIELSMNPAFDGRAMGTLRTLKNLDTGHNLRRPPE